MNKFSQSIEGYFELELKKQKEYLYIVNFIYIIRRILKMSNF